MWKSSSVVGLALCLSVAATTCMAASDNGGNVGPQRVTGTQTGSSAGAKSGNGDRLNRDLQCQQTQSYLPLLARQDRNNLMQQIPAGVPAGGRRKKLTPRALRRSTPL